MVGGTIFLNLGAGMALLLPRLMVGRSIDMRLLEFCFLDFILAAVIAAVAVFIATVPLLILAIWVPFYRQRFHAIFRLPGMDFESAGAYNDDRTEETDA